MSLEQQAHYVELGKQLHEKEVKEKRFQDNFSILEEKFNKDTTSIKLKVSNIHTQTIQEIIENIDETSDKLYDDDEIYYILYSKFLKYKLEQSKKEIEKQKEDISDLETMNATYVEELEENDIEIEDILQNLEYNKNNYNYMFYFMFFCFSYMTINFITLLLYGEKKFNYFWHSVLYGLLYILEQIFNIVLHSFINIFYILKITSLQTFNTITYFWIPLSIIICAGYAGYQLYFLYKKYYKTRGLKED